MKIYLNFIQTFIFYFIPVFSEVINHPFCSCTDALRHRFLCGPKWRVESSISMTRWGIGFTAIRIVEEYIYGSQQVSNEANWKKNHAFLSLSEK